MAKRPRHSQRNATRSVRPVRSRKVNVTSSPDVEDTAFASPGSDESPTAESSVQRLPGGTTRSEKAPPFHLLPPEGLRRIAERFGLGAEIHGEDNWQAAMSSEAGRSAFVRSAFDHMVEHALKLSAGEESDDDHLAAIGWTVFTLAFLEARFGRLQSAR